MEILTAEQIRAWDQYTINKLPISSIDLMEVAATSCVHWIQERNWQAKTFRIFCGKGNNGGDGLAIARLLSQWGYDVSVYILEFGKIGSPDFQTNLQRLHELPAVQIVFLQSLQNVPVIDANDIVIDALFGSGLSRPLEGFAAQLVEYLNQAGAPIISIDLPSGLFSEVSSIGHAVIKADHTLTFQCYKLALLLQVNAPFIGEVTVLDIGLSPGYLQQTKTSYFLLDEKMIRELYLPRNRFSHKGSFGHALLAGGSFGKMGAMVLATKACLHAGAGLTTSLIPRCGYGILQTTAPEAMVIADTEENHLASLPDDIHRFSAIGIGPGMGTEKETLGLLSFLVRRYQKPMVIDADGLNCLAKEKDLLSQLPPNSILTPHPKEFDRLFCDHATDFSRLQTAQQKAAELTIILIVKSHHTIIALPDGRCYFNSTGNAGMAKGGSGDVLTGILTSLLAQGYAPEAAAKFGVYLHGWAGDLAAIKYSPEAMLPSNLVGSLADVFLALR